MTVLVAVASRHHSAFEIGQAIGRSLVDLGVPADVLTVEEVEGVGGYDAVVLGSGVYAGNWLPAARDFVSRCASGLTDRPVWLFSSGPTGQGDPVTLMKGWRFPEALQPTADQIKPREIILFHGAMDLARMQFADRLIIKAIKTPTGDFRDWPAIEAWATAIAHELAPVAA